MARFELDKRETEYGFPCSICKNNDQSAHQCAKDCAIYNKESSEVYDLERAIEKAFNDASTKEPK